MSELARKELDKKLEAMAETCRAPDCVHDHEIRFMCGPCNCKLFNAAYQNGILFLFCVKCDEVAAAFGIREE